MGKSAMTNTISVQDHSFLAIFTVRTGNLDIWGLYFVQLF